MQTGIADCDEQETVCSIQFLHSNQSWSWSDFGSIVESFAGHPKMLPAD